MATGSVHVILTPAQRDAIFEEIQFAFESAGDLLFMLEHADEGARDREIARDVISRLHVGVRLLDQLGWTPRGMRDAYLLEVDEAADWFAARIESFARAGLEHNRPGLFAGDDRTRAIARGLIDSDLEKLRAARAVRSAFKVARRLEAKVEQLTDSQ